MNHRSAHLKDQSTGNDTLKKKKGKEKNRISELV